jgi:hypothetical protein
MGQSQGNLLGMANFQEPERDGSLSKRTPLNSEVRFQVFGRSCSSQVGPTAVDIGLQTASYPFPSKGKSEIYQSQAPFCFPDGELGSGAARKQGAGFTLFS